MTSGSKPAAGGRPATPRADLAAVHLVRESNGVEAFRRFMDSYRRHPSGVEHEVVLVLKGFASAAAAEPYVALAADLEPRCVRVPDEGFDLGAYRRAAMELPHRRLALLNSFSVILADGWLGLLSAPLDDPRVAAVAATASWGSHVSHMRYEIGMGGPYARVFRDREDTHRVFATLAGQSPGTRVGTARSALQRLHQAGTIARQLVGFAPFPAPHLRTNGLLVDRESWLSACTHAPRDKLAAHRMESGRRGITARLRAGGRELLVAARDGGMFDCSQWPRSVTFWQGDQHNLLIGDNQTLAYHEGDALTRGVLSGYAWGPHAAPVDPRVAETV